MRNSSLGPLLIAVAALLWASDGLVRYPLIQKGFDPIWLVFLDHFICSVILFPIAYAKYRQALFQLKASQWLGLGLIGAGASALATLLFTASFRHVNPSVSILLQKLQPLFVVALAMIFLKERPKGKFWLWGFLALIAGLVLSFPNLDFSFTHQITLQSLGVIYALSAAALWGLATVLGKGVLRTLSPLLVTTWRYGFGLVTLLILLALNGVGMPTLTGDATVLRSIAYMSLVPGLLAMSAYYAGLQRTPASRVTLLELIFPVSAVVLNTFFLGTPLSAVQIIAGAVLIFAITQVRSE